MLLLRRAGERACPCLRKDVSMCRASMRALRLAVRWLIRGSMLPCLSSRVGIFKYNTATDDWDEKRESWAVVDGTRTVVRVRDIGVLKESLGVLVVLKES